MRVKFKNFDSNDGGFISYKVLNEVPVVEWDDNLKKYCNQIEISILGLVPEELLEETDDTEIDAVDVHIELQNILKT